MDTCSFTGFVRFLLYIYSDNIGFQYQPTILKWTLYKASLPKVDLFIGSKAFVIITSLVE